MTEKKWVVHLNLRNLISHFSSSLEVEKVKLA